MPTLAQIPGVDDIAGLTQALSGLDILTMLALIVVLAFLVLFAVIRVAAAFIRSASRNESEDNQNTASLIEIAAGAVGGINRLADEIRGLSQSVKDMVGHVGMYLEKTARSYAEISDKQDTILAAIQQEATDTRTALDPIQTTLSTVEADLQLIKGRLLNAGSRQEAPNK